ncbi:MAG: hypothetical protein JW717_04965 [Marinilabiliaceae bacterium]|nr:hypothetical protein [Marinilabiliaceae bacterium]
MKVICINKIFKVVAVNNTLKDQIDTIWTKEGIIGFKQNKLLWLRKYNLMFANIRSYAIAGLCGCYCMLTWLHQWVTRPASAMKRQQRIPASVTSNVKTDLLSSIIKLKK